MKFKVPKGLVTHPGVMAARSVTRWSCEKRYEVALREGWHFHLLDNATRPGPGARTAGFFDTVQEFRDAYPTKWEDHRYPPTSP